MMMMMVEKLKKMVVVARMVIKILFDNFHPHGLAECQEKQMYMYAHPETPPAVIFTRSELRSGKADWDDQNLALPRGARRMNT